MKTCAFRRCFALRVAAVNGLRISNGLRGTNGLSSTTGLMTNPAGRETVGYLVRCALAAGQSFTKKDQNGVSYTFKGEPEWADGACGTACQEGVSACLLAHVNTTGQHISIWLDGNVDGIGWGQSTGHPHEEGSFFGNVFESPPRAYYCNEKDFDQGVVPGRLGANQANAPYTNPWNKPNLTGKCSDYCTPMDIPYQNDGYKACNGLNRVVTVWRNFDASTDYKICNRVSGKCLDAVGTGEGTNIVQNTYASSKASQKWQIVQVNTKQYKVINKASGRALSVYQALTADRTPIVQSAYAGSNAQLWSFTSMGDGTGFHALSPVSNVKGVVALPSANNADNQAVQEFAWKSSAAHMQWSIGIAR